MAAAAADARQAAAACPPLPCQQTPLARHRACSRPLMLRVEPWPSWLCTPPPAPQNTHTADVEEVPDGDWFCWWCAKERHKRYLHPKTQVCDATTELRMQPRLKHEAHVRAGRHARSCCRVCAHRPPLPHASCHPHQFKPPHHNAHIMVATTDKAELFHKCVCVVCAQLQRGATRAACATLPCVVRCAAAPVGPSVVFACRTAWGACRPSHACVSTRAGPS
jgi:hypothetical protein